MSSLRHFVDWGTWTICAISCLIWLFVATHLFHALDPVDDFSYDWMMRQARAAPRIDPELTLVLIDDNSFDVMQERPLSRATHTQLLKGLTAAGVDQVTWDVIFRHESEHDEQLAAAMRDVTSILGCEGTLGGVASAESTTVLPDPIWLDAPGRAYWPFPDYALGLVPQPELAAAAAGIGHLSATVDRDGTLRRIPLLVKVGDRYLPSLVLSSILHDLKLHRAPLDYDASTRVLDIGDGQVIIPLDDQGAMLVNLVNDPEAIDRRSYGQLLRSLQFDAEAMRDGLAGKNVIVGPAYGGSGDFVATPHSASYLGVLVIFSAINTITTGQFIAPAPQAMTGILALLLILIMGILSCMHRTLLASVAMVAALGLTAGFIILCFRFASVFIPPAIPMGAGLTTAIVLIGFGRYRAHRQAARLATMLARFVSPTLLRELHAHGAKELMPQVQRVEVTVLFADIVNFTQYTESHEPEQVSAFLGMLYGRAMDVLFAHEGTLDKMLGDGILAYWGAPDMVEDMELRAVQAAITLQGLAASLRKERGDDWPHVRCGLATGEVTAGYLGDERHAAYTVIGRAVNLAARLEGHAQPDQIIIDEKTAQQVEAYLEIEALPPVSLQGIRGDVPVWRVLSTCDDLKDDLQDDLQDDLLPAD